MEFYVDHLERVRRCGTTVAQLAGEVVTAKEQDGRSRDYICDLRLRLNRFCQDFGDQPIAAIGVRELDNWLRALPGSPKSRANYRANVGVLFSYATEREILDKNPVLRTAKPKLLDKPPEIFRVDELAALLDAASRVEPDALPMLAIGAFAGLREAEIQRLDWSEVDLRRGHIEVKAAKAKSAKRRIVPIQPNLTAWLRPYASRTGRMVPAGARSKLDRVRKSCRSRALADEWVASFVRVLSTRSNPRCAPCRLRAWPYQPADALHHVSRDCVARRSGAVLED